MSLIPSATRSPTSAASASAAVADFGSLPARWRPWLWAARVAMGLVIAAWMLLLFAWLALHFWILPHIGEWRGPIQDRATRALGVPVRIGAIEVRSSGWVPSLVLRDVVLLGADQRAVLELPRVYAALSPRSLLSFELRLEQLLVDDAQLEVRRDASGRLFVAGLELTGAGPAAGGGSANPAADWFFAQREFVIRGGSVRWIDEQRGAAPLALSQVRLVVRNGLRQHDIRLDATPPPEWGERMTLVGRFTQPLLARRGEWQRWSGTAYADLPRIDVRRLRDYMSLPVDLSQGVGALRGWIDWRDGRPDAATVDVALRAVTLRLSPRVDPLSVEEVEGRLAAQRLSDGFSVAAQRVTFLTGDGLRWPQADLSLAWHQPDGQAVLGGEFSAQRLDVGLMAQIASRIPLGDALNRLLTELHPKGTITDLSAGWRGPLDAPTAYRVRALLANVSLDARPSTAPDGVGRPGLRGGTIQLDATQAGGMARLSMNGGHLELPGVFEEARVPIDQLAGQMAWTIEPAAQGQLPRVTVKVSRTTFANADARGELTALWRTGEGSGLARGGRYPGRLELDARITDGDLARASRYVPQGISRDVRQYVENAFLAGRLTSANFHVKGDLWDFPFLPAAGTRSAGLRAAPAGAGEFRIQARLDDAEYAFVPNAPARGREPAFVSPWPALSKVGIDLALDRGTLELRGGRGRFGAVELLGVQGAVRHLESAAMLTLDATARGPLTDMLGFVNSSPVGDWTGRALAAATATGAAELKLGLALPLERIATGTARGSLALPGNDLRFAPGTPLLASAKGRVDFTQKTFSLAGASARIYGGDALLEGGLGADGTLRFGAQGQVSAEGLRRASELGGMARAAGALSGQASYRATLGLVQGALELGITSTLAGMAIQLPAPLAKSAEAVLPLRFQTSVDLATAANGQAVRDTLRLELGSVLQASYLRDISGDQPRVLRGSVGVLEAPPAWPVGGVAARVTLKTLPFDDWESISERLLGGADAQPASNAVGGYAPDTIAVRAQEIVSGTRRLTRVTGTLAQDAGAWHAQVDADQLNGVIEYRPPSRRGAATSSAGRLHARLSRLSLPRSEVAQVEALLDQQPLSLPALDIVVENLELRGRKLGRVEIEANNRSSPSTTSPVRDTVREWQLSKFNISLPEAQLSATGYWSAVGPSTGSGTAAAGRVTGARRSAMDFKLAITDGGALLERLGHAGTFRGGKGQLAGHVEWLGSPLELDYASLSGDVKVAIESGQFLKADPGVARLLGVLNLQALPRRLLFDFRDLFQEGFAFDSIGGDVSIAQGQARTRNLRMRGVQAVVLMEGSADLQRETQDLRVVVVPELGAGTAALAYAVINPAVGLGAFLAQAFLNKSLTQANTREFHVTGPWADPKVERVDRTAETEPVVPQAGVTPPATAQSPAASAPG